METRDIPLRRDIPPEYKWDLTSLFKDDGEWEGALASLGALSAAVVCRRGTLGTSPEGLLGGLAVWAAFEETAEAVGCYASLLTSADTGDSAAQEKQTRFVMALTEYEAAHSFFLPELQGIPEERIRPWLAAPEFAPWSFFLEKMLRLKPHVLGPAEEKILALQTGAARTSGRAFSLLTNADMDFGAITVNGEARPLTQSSFSSFMEDQDRDLRQRAYLQFYSAFEGHKNVLAGLYEGSVTQDIFEARSRGYPSCRDMALFPDRVPGAVYDSLVGAVRENLGALHRYYQVRARALGLAELRHYDVYVPLVGGLKTVTPYESAADLVCRALSPLGTDYTDTLRRGLLSGWVDRYENRGKRSGAFSSGTYRSCPYILLNYKDDLLRDVFTIAHEGGHSMHSWYSARSNPFQNYQYTIFEAEVASTFNEELLFRHLLKTAPDRATETYLLCMRAADIVATLYRQTMFAEFEDRTHRMAEQGEPLTVDALRAVYRGLLGDYFGPAMVLEDVSDLEGLRIPHFYSAFYVYKYATGISAALALADRVLTGGASEREDYFAFLRSGGSRYPLESLRLAGVDMESPAPVRSALGGFADIVAQLESRF
ncbi:MAG: oligoendopeptidase F [Spirochaetaceae bacterium]|jgi:oligoendopeptidase F|nr:oligoendopeptidase F [Spirochaetaceae bacterium]